MDPSQLSEPFLSADRRSPADREQRATGAPALRSEGTGVQAARVRSAGGQAAMLKRRKTPLTRDRSTAGSKGLMM